MWLHISRPTKLFKFLSATKSHFSEYNPQNNSKIFSHKDSTALLSNKAVNNSNALRGLVKQITAQYLMQY